MRRLRVVIFYLFSYIATVLFATGSLLFFWLPATKRWWFVDTFGRLMLWAGEFFCGMKVTVEGTEHLPKTPSVIMIKHTTALETYGHIPFFPEQPGF